MLRLLRVNERQMSDKVADIYHAHTSTNDWAMPVGVILVCIGDTAICYIQCSYCEQNEKCLLVVGKYHK